ncbi:MAG: hypothetical protein K2X66_12290 [Cyanobacteria bacterium]|nr:hypothetical protein [Cyanobacteriota bacterium]
MVSLQSMQRQTPLFGQSPRMGETNPSKESQSARSSEAMMVVRQGRKAEAKAVQYAHAPIPAFDYIQGRFTLERGTDFMEKTFHVKGEPLFTGEELLNLLMSPQGINPRSIPNAERLSPYDFSQLGVPEKSLHQAADAKNHHVVHWIDAVNEGRRMGILYQLKDVKRGVTYYGIPTNVREALKLKLPEPKAAEATISDAGLNPQKLQLTPFGKALQEVLTLAKILSPKDELFEFTAQLLHSAIGGNLFPSNQVPEPFQKPLAEMHVEDALEGTILNLYEASHGTTLAPKVRDLCSVAMEAGHLDEKTFKECQAVLAA